MHKNYPVIIPRGEHNISRRNLSPNAVRVLYRLKENGFLAYLVGGCVRDLLLDRHPKDFDIVTNATPGQIKRLFRNCRLVGRRFRLAHLHFNDEIIEVSTFRATGPDAADGDGAQDNGAEHPPRHLKSEHGVVLRDNLFGTPEEDALRRDFTINALFYNVADFSIIDYADGLADLRAGVIKSIGDPWQRFTEDPVRMIRAVRFAASLDIPMAEDTWTALLDLSPTIIRSAPARLYEELLKLLLCGAGEKGWQLLERTGLLRALLPGLANMLEETGDGLTIATVGRALCRADRLRADGITMPPQLLLALLFGPYLEGKTEIARQKGMSSQDALNMAVAALFEVMTTTLRIPQKVVLQVRDILASQHRMRKIPGRNPQGFMARSGFAEALLYLCWKGESDPEANRVWKWWESMHKAINVDCTGATSPDEGALQVRRRRRKKRRHVKAKI